MQRRNFLKLASFSAWPGWTGETAGKSQWPADDVREKVKRAMLAMQRDAWEQGVAAQALLESGERDLVVVMAREAALRQDDDGRLAVLSCFGGVTDPAANGPALLWAAAATADPTLKKAAERMLDFLLRRAPRAADGILFHILDKPQIWVDSLFMAPPFLAAAGEFVEAVKQIEGIRRRLWNPNKKLFSAIWDEGQQKFERGDCWGVGNGWAAAGMCRVALALPTAMASDKTRLVGYVADLLDGCLRHQRPDGLFHDVVDDPSSFIETNLAQMLAYVIFRGVKAGCLKPTYLKPAARMRRAARAKIDNYGLVRGVCGSPDFSAPGTACEGQAFFLLMEAAALDG